MNLKPIRHLLLIACIQFLSVGYLQSQNKWSINGYISEAPFYYWNQEDAAYFNNLILNQINVQHELASSLHLNLSLRNQLHIGGHIKHNPIYKYIIDNDPGLIDLSSNLTSGKSSVLNSKIDRVNLSFKNERWAFNLGRHRVDWSVTQIWNPIDIFNIYSYFDFEYPEKPAMDGISSAINISKTAQLKGALKFNQNGLTTSALALAGKYQNYKYQLMLGNILENEFIIGLSGAYSSTSTNIYGEIAYFPQSPGEKNDHIIISTGFSHLWKNHSLKFEYLFTDYLNRIINSNSSLIQNQISIKNISIADHNFYASYNNTINKKLKLGIDIMSFGVPLLDSYFICPNLTLNLSSRFSFTSYMQFFNQDLTQERQSTVLSSLKLQYYF